MNAENLPPGQTAAEHSTEAKNRAGWLKIARNVLAGDYINLGPFMRDSFIIGLRGIDHPDARMAVEKLRGMK